MNVLVRTSSKRSRSRSHPPVGGAGGVVVDLGHERAFDVDVVGAKAANLARAAAAGLPVLPGFVVPTHVAAAAAALGGVRHLANGDLAVLRQAWEAFGSREVVVRSSSPGEDLGHSSMAGRFTSVLDVGSWPELLRAIDEVVDSARIVSIEAAAEQDPYEIAVLIQPQLAPRVGGVMFGVDPVSGRADRLLVAAAQGRPDDLVSGRVEGSRLVLGRHGRLHEADGDVLLGARERRALARLAAKVATHFGGPQDTEWAIDVDGTLWLLQSRPVTAVAEIATGPVLGPGPVAESFPDPLTPLEQDLWLDPLREAMRHAISLTGVIPARRLERSPVVTTVAGRAAADLEVLGIERGRTGLIAKLDPRPPARRLVAAWRTGRLRVALPALADDLLATTDAELASIPAVGSMDHLELVDVLNGGHRLLVALHGQEVLAGLLLHAGATAPSGAAAGLVALHRGRTAGLSDEAIVARSPEVLALLAPAIGATHELPAVMVAPSFSSEASDDVARQREALRLRVRWVQELMARVAAELGVRLVRDGLLPDVESVRWLRADELRHMALAGWPAPADLATRPVAASPPLPARFRLTEAGTPVAIGGASADDGQGAGGGRGSGVVVHDVADLPSTGGGVLVTRTLDPSLAPHLARLSGLIAETGSVLSHLAILAREMGLPTVVGVPGALERFAPGVRVVLDGATGEIEVAD